MTRLEQDTKTAIGWLVDVALECTRAALAHQSTADALMDKVVVITACADLPGDMPLRVRCFQNVFRLQA